MAAVAMRDNIKIYPNIQCKFLLILKMGEPEITGTYWMQCIYFGLPFSMIWLTDILTCGSKYNFRLIMVLKKMNKNIVELLDSIYE